MECALQLATQTHHPALSRFPTGRSTQLEALVSSVRASLSLRIEETDEVTPIVASQLRSFLSARELLNQTQRQPNAHRYQRHALYRDEAGEFTIFALIWLPGQETPIHGHMAWSAMGLYAGELNLTHYEIFGTRAGQMHLKQISEADIREGDVNSVTGDINDIHRIRNTSCKPAISIHVCSMDVAAESQSLNILFPQ